MSSDQPGSSPPRWLRQVPNALSVLRLGLAFAFPWFSVPWRVAAAVVAGGSDGLDGYIARRYGVTSAVGALLDAIGDKLFVGIAVITLSLEGAFPLWCAGLVLLRDLSVAGSGLIVAISREWWAFRQMPPHELGKITTALQFVVVVVAMIWSPALPYLLVPTIAASFAAAVTYVSRFWRMRPQP